MGQEIHSSLFWCGDTTMLEEFTWFNTHLLLIETRRECSPQNLAGGVLCGFLYCFVSWRPKPTERSNFGTRPPMGGDRQRSVSFMRCCLDICCIIEVQASRLLFCRMFLYIQQFISVVFVAYAGAGTEGLSLWLSLFTSLGGVILGTEISRVLNLHVFYSTKATRSDLIFIDLKHQQRLLSRLRLGLLLCGLSNLGMAFLRFINYYAQTQTRVNAGFSNFTSWFQQSTNYTSWSELGLWTARTIALVWGIFKRRARP